MREGWEYKKLGVVSKVIMGQSPDGNSVNSSNGIEFHQGKVFFGEKYLDVSNSFTEQPSKIAEPNSVLLCVRAPVGIVNITQRRICIGRGLCAIQPNDILTMPFLFYALTQKQAYFDKNSTGSTFKAISSKVVLNTEIPVPPISEQERIVSELDLLSGIIEKKKEQLEELDNLAQAVFYDMFGDPVTNEKGWEVIQLGSKCEVSSFKRVLVEDVVEEGIPFIRGTELMFLSNGDYQPFTMFITPEHYEQVKAISGVPQVGDLLIPSINANGNIWILNTEEPRYYKDGRVLWVHLNKEAYSSQALKFIMHYLIKNTYSSVASGATFAELKLFVLRELKTILPPLSLQQSFAEKIEAIEKQKEHIKQSITEVETLFNSRMDYYFN